MGLERAAIHEIVKEKFAAAVVDDQRDVVDPFIAVKPDVVLELARFLRDDDRLSFDLLSVIAGIDYPDRETIEVVYCLESTTAGHSLIVKTPLSRDKPVVSSVESVWRTADWHERETYDLVGVDFEGHPNLVRILCAEDWEGHPLRKDYEPPAYYRGIKNIVY